MVADKKYMEELCSKFNICDYLLRETPTDAFIQWYMDHKEKYDGKIQLKEFDVLSVMFLFENDLESMYEKNEV